MDFSDYINTELFVIVPVLYAVGVLIKKSSIPDRYIPIILGVIGISLATVYCFARNAPSGASDVLMTAYAGVTQGILCAATSVYANNIVKQMQRKDGCEDDNKSDNT